ncbi:hypothetical protein WJT74_03710 [Sphingomicrobium sp. XHP0239]|uniref:hypothetical protein n=1 Tax=Sphingomicrobium maritimum TaxID=3133972 RepID=UPI0031CC8E7E
MKRIFTALAATTLAVAAPATPAFAQQAPSGVNVGMQVVDTQGNPVGLVAASDADFITVKTDKHSIPVPANSFTPHEGKLLFGMNAAALNASYEQALADMEASVAVGKPVKDVQGVEFGMIDEIAADYIQLEMADTGKVVRVPVDALQKDAGGAIALYNAADLRAEAIDRPEAMAATDEAPADEVVATETAPADEMVEMEENGGDAMDADVL